MSADDLLRAMLSTLPTRQLRRGRIRQWNRVLTRWVDAPARQR